MEIKQLFTDSEIIFKEQKLKFLWSYYLGYDNNCVKISLYCPCPVTQSWPSSKQLRVQYTKGTEEIAHV